MIERRRFHRFEDVPVRVRLRKEECFASIDAEIKDISIGGIKIRTDEVINIYDFYDLKICFHGCSEPEGIAAKAKVWRIEPDTEKNNDISRFAALEFVSFEEGDRRIFTKFLAGFLMGSGTEVV
ncbi:PilZ domain-containing protein [Geovibrio thiophilus]|uniref:PilZ domain-containing protein n=1 Tax=Geovibrio thiophilus TaxID=139438 RepID=A0A410K102_9BACT|nr:PilZ domain-containing protein [Geovibrio thiophilus]QAR34136.1 PilZ domain-containing protein [Geovibrio thiophilus]